MARTAAPTRRGRSGRRLGRGRRDRLAPVHRPLLWSAIGWRATERVRVERAVSGNAAQPGWRSGRQAGRVEAAPRPPPRAGASALPVEGKGAARGGRVSRARRSSPKIVARRREPGGCARLNAPRAASSPSVENVQGPLRAGKGGMIEKLRNVIRGLAGAGTQHAGPAAKRPALIEASPTHLADAGDKGALSPRGRRRASRPPHCTDVRHVTVRPHALEVCLAPVDRAPPGFAHGRDRPWRATPRALPRHGRRRQAPGGRSAMSSAGVCGAGRGPVHPGRRRAVSAPGAPAAARAHGTRLRVPDGARPGPEPRRREATRVPAARSPGDARASRSRGAGRCESASTSCTTSIWRETPSLA